MRAGIGNNYYTYERIRFKMGISTSLKKKMFLLPLYLYPAMPINMVVKKKKKILLDT